MSLDGFIAGANQDEQNPLGLGGMDLHAWLFELGTWRNAHGEQGGVVNASTRVAQELEEGFGAVVMGRNMFGPVRGPWGDDLWRGWWRENPPYHAPVMVLTHHPRALLLDGRQRLIGVWALDIADGQIANINVVVNPDN